MTGTNGNGNGAQVGTLRVKQGLAQMLKGGVIVSFYFSCSFMVMVAFGRLMASFL